MPSTEKNVIRNLTKYICIHNVNKMLIIALCKSLYLILLLEKRKTFSKSSRGKEEQTKCFAINRNYNMNAKYIMNNLLSYQKKR